jgi:hypothetical protein
MREASRVVAQLLEIVQALSAAVAGLRVLTPPLPVACRRCSAQQPAEVTTKARHKDEVVLLL